MGYVKSPAIAYDLRLAPFKLILNLDKILIPIVCKMEQYKLFDFNSNSLLPIQFL